MSAYDPTALARLSQRERDACIAESMSCFACARAILGGGDQAKLAAIFNQRARTVVFATREMAEVAQAVGVERERQEQLRPGERLVDGTGASAKQLADIVRQWCDDADVAGSCSYALVLVEEVLEALAEDDLVKLRREVVQVAALCVKWLEDIERRIGR